MTYGIMLGILIAGLFTAIGMFLWGIYNKRANRESGIQHVKEAISINEVSAQSVNKRKSRRKRKKHNKHKKIKPYQIFVIIVAVVFSALILWYAVTSCS